jgi:hypothetical protein
MERLTHNQIFTGSTLKLIAIVTMFIDHFGAVVVGQGLLALPSVRTNSELYHQIYLFYRILRYIGRLAFPIFCFLLVEGFLHTRSKEKYLLRLGLFTLISEIPFDLAIYGDWYYPDKQNVFFTLFFGMLVMVLADRIKNEWGQFLIMAAGISLGYFFQTDYGARGVFLICLLYLLRYARPLQCFGGAMVMLYELTAPLAFLPVLFYNGKKGRLRFKYFFYWFYPVHLLLLAGIRALLLHGA